MTTYQSCFSYVLALCVYCLMILRRPLLSYRQGPGGTGYRLYVGGLEPGLTTQVLKEWVAAAGGESATLPLIEYPGVTEQ